MRCKPTTEPKNVLRPERSRPDGLTPPTQGSAPANPKIPNGLASKRSAKHKPRSDAGGAVRCSDDFLCLKNQVTQAANPSACIPSMNPFIQNCELRNTAPGLCILKETVSFWPAICIDFHMPAKSAPLFLLLLTCSTGCVTQQRYADVLREVEQKEKQQRKLESQLQALRAQNERMRDSLTIYRD